MKKEWFLLLLFTSIAVFAQQEPNLALYKTKNEKLKAWLKYTNEVLDADNYPKLLIAAQKGIVLSNDQLAYKSRFYFLKGNAYEFNNNQTKNALINYELALKYAQKARHLKNETSALMRLNYAYYALNETSKREQLIAYIKQVLDTTKSSYTKSVLYGSLGEYYLDNAQYETFIGYQLKAINYKKLLKKTVANNETIGVSYSQIAAAYTKMKQYNKAIEYLNYAQPYIKTSPYISAFSCNYYLQCFVPLKNLDSIQKYYTLIYTFPSKKDSLFLNLSFANKSVSEYYANKGQPDIAFNYAKKAVLLGKKSNDQDIIMEANAVMGRVL
ncbi:MAG: hypothetical protein WAM46_06005, partial [Flavobacterium sp.]